MLKILLTLILAAFCLAPFMASGQATSCPKGSVTNSFLWQGSISFGLCFEVDYIPWAEGTTSATDNCPVDSFVTSMELVGSTANLECTPLPAAFTSCQPQPRSMTPGDPVMLGTDEVITGFDVTAQLVYSITLSYDCSVSYEPYQPVACTEGLEVMASFFRNGSFQCASVLPSYGADFSGDSNTYSACSRHQLVYMMSTGAPPAAACTIFSKIETSLVESVSPIYMPLVCPPGSVLRSLNPTNPTPCGEIKFRGVFRAFDCLAEFNGLQYPGSTGSICKQIMKHNPLGILSSQFIDENNPIVIQEGDSCPDNGIVYKYDELGFYCYKPILDNYESQLVTGVTDTIAETFEATDPWACYDPNNNIYMNIGGLTRGYNDAFGGYFWLLVCRHYIPKNVYIDGSGNEMECPLGTCISAPTTPDAKFSCTYPSGGSVPNTERLYDAGPDPCPPAFCTARLRSATSSSLCLALTDLTFPSVPDVAVFIDDFPISDTERYLNMFEADIYLYFGGPWTASLTARNILCPANQVVVSDTTCTPFELVGDHIANPSLITYRLLCNSNELGVAISSNQAGCVEMANGIQYSGHTSSPISTGCEPLVPGYDVFFAGFGTEVYSPPTMQCALFLNTDTTTTEAETTTIGVEPTTTTEGSNISVPMTTSCPEGYIASYFEYDGTTVTFKGCFEVDYLTWGEPTFLSAGSCPSGSMAIAMGTDGTDVYLECVNLPLSIRSCILTPEIRHLDTTFPTNNYLGYGYALQSVDLVAQEYSIIYTVGGPCRPDYSVYGPKACPTNQLMTAYYVNGTLICSPAPATFGGISYTTNSPSDSCGNQMFAIAVVSVYPSMMVTCQRYSKVETSQLGSNTGFGLFSCQEGFYLFSLTYSTCLAVNVLSDIRGFDCLAVLSGTQFPGSDGANCQQVMSYNPNGVLTDQFIDENSLTIVQEGSVCPDNGIVYKYTAQGFFCYAPKLDNYETTDLQDSEYQEQFAGNSGAADVWKCGSGYLAGLRYYDDSYGGWYLLVCRRYVPINLDKDAGGNPFECPTGTCLSTPTADGRFTCQPPPYPAVPYTEQILSIDSSRLCPLTACAINTAASSYLLKCMFMHNYSIGSNTDTVTFGDHPITDSLKFVVEYPTPRTVVLDGGREVPSHKDILCPAQQAVISDESCGPAALAGDHIASPGLITYRFVCLNTELGVAIKGFQAGCVTMADSNNWGFSTYFGQIVGAANGGCEIMGAGVAGRFIGFTNDYDYSDRSVIFAQFAWCAQIAYTPTSEVTTTSETETSTEETETSTAGSSTSTPSTETAEHSTETTDPSGAETTTGPSGTDPSETETTDPSGTETTDPSGTSPSGTETTDPSDTETTDHSGTETTDPSGTSPSGTETTDPSDTETTDPSDTETTDPSGTAETTTDPSGTSPSGTETTDPSGTETTDPSGTSPSGTETTDPSDTETTDPSGTETTGPSGTDPSGTTETTNPSGTETDPSGTTETTGSSATETTDPSGTETTNPSGTSPSRTETTDPSGTETTDPSGTTETTNPSGTETTGPSATGGTQMTSSADSTGTVGPSDTTTSPYVTGANTTSSTTTSAVPATTNPIYDDSTVTTLPPDANRSTVLVIERDGYQVYFDLDTIYVYFTARLDIDFALSIRDKIGVWIAQVLKIRISSVHIRSMVPGSTVMEIVVTNATSYGLTAPAAYDMLVAASRDTTSPMFDPLSVIDNTIKVAYSEIKSVFMSLINGETPNAVTGGVIGGVGGATIAIAIIVICCCVQRCPLYKYRICKDKSEVEDESTVDDGSGGSTANPLKKKAVKGVDDFDEEESNALWDQQYLMATQLAAENGKPKWSPNMKAFGAHTISHRQFGEAKLQRRSSLRAVVVDGADEIVDLTTDVEEAKELADPTMVQETPIPLGGGDLETLTGRSVQLQAVRGLPPSVLGISTSSRDQPAAPQSQTKTQHKRPGGDDGHTTVRVERKSRMINAEAEAIHSLLHSGMNVPNMLLLPDTSSSEDSSGSSDGDDLASNHSADSLQGHEELTHIQPPESKIKITSEALKALEVQGSAPVLLSRPTSALTATSSDYKIPPVIEEELPSPIANPIVVEGPPAKPRKGHHSNPSKKFTFGPSYVNKNKY